MKTSDGIKLKSWQRAFIYLAVWLAAVVGIKLISDVWLGSILLHIAYVMILLPLTTMITALMYTRVCGLKPWLILYMSAAVLILYFAFGYKELSPDFIITNIICGFFGFGLGNIFKNEAKVAVQEDRDNIRKKLRQEAERNYVPIYESDPKTKQKADVRKKKKKR